MSSFKYCYSLHSTMYALTRTCLLAEGKTLTVFIDPVSLDNVRADAALNDLQDRAMEAGRYLTHGVAQVSKGGDTKGQVDKLRPGD